MRMAGRADFLVNLEAALDGRHVVGAEDAVFGPGRCATVRFRRSGAEHSAAVAGGRGHCRSGGAAQVRRLASLGWCCFSHRRGERRTAFLRKRARAPNFAQAITARSHRGCWQGSGRAFFSLRPRNQARSRGSAGSNRTWRHARSRQASPAAIGRRHRSARTSPQPAASGTTCRSGGNARCAQARCRATAGRTAG